MNKIAVIFWSGTGNTEAMANAVVDGIKKAGVEVELFQVDSFDITELKNYKGFAFGCPAMGAEVLEESSFEPFFTEAEKNLKGISVVLFGSYGWGGGAWMGNWIERTKESGAKFIGNVISENDPSNETLKECNELGKSLAKSL